MDKWKSALDKTSSTSSRVVRLVELTSKDLGENGLYRVIFAALNETDDVEIKRAMQRLYQRYHVTLDAELVAHHKLLGTSTPTECSDLAWALISMVSFMNMALDLELMDSKERKRFFSAMAFKLIDGSSG
jgi:hypothetical protein